jgi:hypothetical protein
VSTLTDFAIAAPLGFAAGWFSGLMAASRWRIINRNTAESLEAERFRDHANERGHQHPHDRQENE